MITFDAIPETLYNIQSQLNEMKSVLQNISTSQPVNELPIDSAEIKRRLQISEPTLVRLRKQHRIPFLEVGGSIRYRWTDVLKALEKNRH